jgi:hypothetical protein
VRGMCWVDFQAIFAAAYMLGQLAGDCCRSAYILLVCAGSC